VNTMKDAFFDFEWPVATGYKWENWLDSDGSPKTFPPNVLNQLADDLSKCRIRFNSGPDPSPKSREIIRAAGLRDLERDRLSRETGPVLTPVNASNSRRYRPMDPQHSALFRQFAELDFMDATKILTFASTYGWLGLMDPPHQRIPIRNVSGRVRRWHSVAGESHLAWAIEICGMREALHLSEELASFGARQRFMWLYASKLPDVHGWLSFDDARKPQFTIRPVSLISAMWLQLALAITGEKRFVACKFCRRMFEISTEQTGFRSHREFCSESCKTKDYRKRKRTALNLADSGARLREISKKTATGTATVRGWLAAAKQRRGTSGGE
jgi:hypothetical protein